MYFKKLEIIGFKSFLNKTKLKFEPGVTAIVGPNGCGKSNIVDAIKWVLGEQSTKSMRSASMQDVIFNGTEKYDQVNVSEVSLTLSNEDRALPVDYDEVTVSRKLYRSGESEYLLNKTPVRLTDIRNLLMGTGIGTSSYSIVEQGRMDMILSSKPEDRRYVFEEASGITRYKAHKREAMLKLERTKENLLRINDIIREVERQIKSIERKARKAERYKVRFEELKNLEVKFSYKKYKEISTDDTSVLSQNKDLRLKAESLSTDIRELQEKINTCRSDYNNVQEELQRAQNEVMMLSSDIDKNRHTIEVNGERVSELRKQVDRLDWEIEEVTERKDKMKERLDGLEVRFEEVSRKRQEKDDALRLAEENVKMITSNLENHRHELKISRDRTVDVATDQTKKKNELIKLNADIQNGLAREKRLKIERNNVQLEKENATNRLSEVTREAEEIKKALEDKKNEYRTFSEEYVAKEQKLSLFKNERVDKEKSLNETRLKKEFLERLISEREGMNESIKKVMERVEAKDPSFSGVHGVLSELINVRDNYEESMGSILAEAAHAVIVENRETAQNVDKFLSENSLESINIMILEDIQRFLSKGSGPFITKGTLDDVTHVTLAEEPYRSAMRALLKDVFVTISPEAARIFIEKDEEFKGRIIGERGEVYQKGMIRTRNYSSKEGIPLFGRREKVEELIQEEEKTASEIERLTQAITELEEWITASSAKKEALENELREKERQNADASSKKQALKEKVDSINEEILILETEIEEERDVLNNLREEKMRIDVLLEEIERENALLKEKIDKFQEEIQENTRRREETLLCMSDIKAELSALRKDEENLSDNLERERGSFQRVDSEVEGKRARITESGDKIRALEEETKNLEEKNIEHNSVLEVKNREIEEKKEKKDLLKQEVERSESSFQTKERELQSARDKARDMDIMKKELEYKKASLVEKILDSYKVNISEITEEVDPEADWDEVKANIVELKDQLEKMGDVSLGAVEEHKQLEERFAFLTKQREDLESARDQLMLAIQRINRTTRKKFMESFEAIKKEFNDYFRMLFNGGKADLILEDEHNVLECGIDIVVRPPGKKLHNIMQLSGGEKAMTAIALIFAIFKVNPSPFCILDEIDAPLDESNVVRFCRVLQEFLKLSQFVIVTHNRMTIQLADILYGITMEEKGVSKIVSVKFTEEKEALEGAEVGTPA